MTRRFGNRAAPSAEEIIDANMQGVYDLIEERTGRPVTEDEQAQVRAFASGAVLDTVEAMEDEEDDEISDIEAAQLLLEGELDTDDLDEDDIAELLQYIPEELIPEMLENNGEDVDAVLGDEEDDEEDDEDEDEYDAEYDDDEDEEDDGEDEEEYDEGRSFAADPGHVMDIEAMINDAYARGRDEAADEINNIFEERDSANERAFALSQEMEENDDFITDLARSGQLAPHLIPLASSLLDACSSITGETRSFAASDMGEFGTNTLSEMARALLANLPKNSSFEDIYTQPDMSDVRSFTSQEFAAVGTNSAVSEEISRAVQGIKNEYAAQGKRITYDQALKALQAASK